MQRIGTPSATICTTPFRPMAEREREALGLPGLPLIIVGHPLGGLRIDEVPTRVAEAGEAFARLVPKG